MRISNFKKNLLIGSAIVGVGFAVSFSPAFAADSFTETDLTANGTEDIVGDGNGDDVWDIDTDQGSTTADITIDTSGGTDTLTIESGAGAQTEADIDTISFTDSTNAAIISVGDGTDNAVMLTVNGNVSGDGTADLSFVVNADGAGTDDEATTLAIKSTVFDLGSGTITLTDDATDNQGDAALLINGTGAQAITGAINGANQGEGTVSVTNAAGIVTFNSGVGSGTEVGAINIGGATGTTTVVFKEVVQTNDADNESGIITIGQTDGGDTNVTFKKAVTTDQGTVLGNGTGTDTNTVTYDGTDAGFTVAGIVNGTAGDTDNVVVTGGNTIVQSGIWGGVSPLDSLALTGTGTKLDQGAAISATTISLATGTTLEVNDAVNGNITGNGTLDVDTGASIDGNVTALAADVANGQVLTIISDDAGTGTAGTVNIGTVTFGDATSGLVLNADADGTTTFTGNIVASAAGAGILTVGGDAAETESYVVNGAIGASDKAIATLEIGDNNASVHTLTTKGNVYANAVVIENGDILNVQGSSVTVSGTVNGNDASEGAVVVGDGTNATNATFGGVIGGVQELAGFKVSEGSTANISNNLLVESATAGALDFDGTVNVDTETVGAVTIDNIDGAGIFALDGTLTTSGSNALTLGSGGTIHAGWNDKNAKLNAGSQVVLNDDLLVGNSTGDVYTININKNANFDPNTTTVIDAAGDTVRVETDSKLVIGITSGSTALASGDTITVIDSDEAVELGVSGNASGSDTDYATLIGSGNVVLKGSGLVTLTDNSSTANDLLVTATFKDAKDVFGDSTGANAANALIGFPTATGNLATIRGNLLSADAEEAQNIAESIAPTVDGGALVAGLNVGNQSADLVNTRLASLSNGTAKTGMAAGNITQGLRAWGQVFGQTGEQDSRDGVAGYDVDTLGFAIGVDTGNLREDTTVGLAFSYGDTEVDSNNANNTNTEIDTYQITLYGQQDLDDRTYVSGQLAYAMGDNDVTRSNVGGISGSTASGDFDSNQYSARVEAGRSYVLSSGPTLTPNVMANYVHYDADSYTETGAGTANLNVDSDSVNLFEVGVGVDASWMNQLADGAYIAPVLSAGVRHDLIGDEFESTSSFTGGGTSFKTEGFDPAQTTFDIGAGLTYYTTSNWELSANYDYEVKSDYDAHAGYLKAAYKF